MNVKNFLDLLKNASQTNTSENIYFLVNVKEYIDESFYVQELMLYFLNFINNFLIPIVICISLPLNFFCIWIFLDSSLKNLVYKFLLFNSIFDLITLSMVGSRLLIKLFAHYNPAIDFYFFSFLSSVSLTCSNLTKIGFSLERIFKLKSSGKLYRKKASFKYIITLIVVIGVLANSSVLFGYSFYSDTFMKQSYYLMVLNDFGRSSAFGIMMVVNAVIVDLGIFLAVVVINLVLLKIIRANSKKLTDMIQPVSDINDDKNNNQIKINENQTTVHFDGNSSVYNDDSDDENEEDISLDQVSEKKVEENKPDLTGGKNEAELNNTDLKSPRKTNDFSREKVAKAKFNLSSMIQSNNLVFLIGHLLFSISGIFVQIRYFFHFGYYMSMCFECFYWVNLMIILSYLMLYASFGANFFIYYYQNRKFYLIFKSKIRSSNDSANENQEDLSEMS